MEFKYKNVLILGYGASGKAVEEVLLNKNISYKIFDSDINLKDGKFVVEFIVRKIVDSKMIKAYPITKFKSDSRKDDYVLCYEDYWTKKKYKTWKDFLTETAKVRKIVEKTNADEWILHCEDYWYFLVTFVALLQCKKSVSLTQNISESFIAEMKKPGVQLWTDVKVNNCDFGFIPDLIENAELPLDAEIRNVPEINAEESSVENEQTDTEN